MHAMYSGSCMATLISTLDECCCGVGDLWARTVFWELYGGANGGIYEHVREMFYFRQPMNVYSTKSAEARTASIVFQIKQDWLSLVYSGCLQHIC